MANLDHKFKLLFEQNPLPILVYDPVTFYFLATNNAATRVYGYGADEFLKMTIFDISASADHLNLRKSLSQSASLLKYGPVNHICKNGQTILVNVYGSDIEIDERPARMVSIEDITQNVLISAELQKVLASSQETSAVLEAFFSHAPVGYAVMTRDLRYLRVNEYLANLNGKTINDHLGKTLDEMAPSIFQHAKGAFGEVFSTGKPIFNVELSFTNQHLPHSKSYFLANFYPIRMASGEIIATGCAVLDITDKKEAEENLQKNETQFRTLAEALPQLIWIADYQGKPVFYNRRFYEYTGLSSSEANVLGVFRHLHVEDSRLCNHRWQQAVATGTPFEAQCRLLCARTHFYRWHVVRAVPLKDETGKVVQWFGSWTDIHEQKVAETNQKLIADITDTLNSSLDFETTLRNLARLALHHFADFVSVYLVEGAGSLRRVFALHADASKEPLVREIEKYSPDLNSAHDVSRVILTGQAKVVTNAESCAAASLGIHSEYQNLLRQLNPTSYMIVPLTARGHNLGAITFISSQADRRYNEVDLQVAKEMGRKAAIAVDNARLYQQSQEAIRVREDVLGVISHDLKNPVAALQLGTQVLQQFLTGDQILEQKSRILKVLDRMEHSAIRATRLIHDILDMAKLASGHVVLEKGFFNAADIIIDSIEMLQPLALQKGIELNHKLNNSNCLVQCDKERLLQVLSNIIGNALKFTAPGGTIEVKLDLLDHCVRIAVGDTGPGISESDIPHIFDRFWQSKRTRKLGAGLGLSIVKGIMDAHGGQVWVESELGKGSTFYISLPRAHSPALRVAQ